MLQSLEYGGNLLYPSARDILMLSTKRTSAKVLK